MRSVSGGRLQSVGRVWRDGAARPNQQLARPGLVCGGCNICADFGDGLLGDFQLCLERGERGLSSAQFALGDVLYDLIDR